MQKRKGFTLVELVIVIAVIAILAGVLIGTFASVINRANESARLQEVKAQEIEQKAEDILKKIEDSNWYGWEDFESNIVKKIVAAYDENKTSLSLEDVKNVVDNAFVTYMANAQTSQTNLTEEQVKAIIENAFGTFKYEGVTEAQVRAIVNSSTTAVLAAQVTPAQIKQIVVTANEKNLTAADVAQAIANAGLATEDNVNAAVSTIINKINTATAVLATKEDVESLKAYIDELKNTTVVQEKTMVEITKTINDPEFTGNKTVTLTEDLIMTSPTGTGTGTNSLTINNENANVTINIGEQTVRAINTNPIPWNGDRIMQLQAGELTINEGTFDTDENNWGFIRTYGGKLTINDTIVKNKREYGCSIKNMGGEVILNNLTVTSVDGAGAVCVDCNITDGMTEGILTINGGTYSQTGAGVNPSNCCDCTVGNGGLGTITINDGTFTCDGGTAVLYGWSSPSTWIINGGTFTASGTNSRTSKATDCINLCKIGSTYTQYGVTSMTINGGTFEGSIYVGAGNTLVIKGGTFTVDPTEYVDTTNYNVTNNGSTWTVTAK